MGELTSLNGNQEYTLNDILLDTGSNSFAIISQDFVNKNKIPTIPLQQPISATLANSTKTSPITHQTIKLEFKVIDTKTNSVISNEPTQFLVLPSTHQVILGLPWCKKHKPEIDWDKLSLSKPLKDITLILNNISLENKDEFTTYTKDYAKTTIAVNEKGIPLLYQEFADVFQEKNNNEAPLPPHRPYDMAIDLDPNNPLPPSPKIYPLAPAHEKILQDYINKALIKGWIAPSQASYAEPIFVVPKPNNEGRCCINYKNTNARTKKIPYPIPLVQELLDKLGKAKVFTRLDLPDAYHLVRIKAGDEFKTAFRCKFGLFEYRVVSFGLTNAPVVFQFFLDDIFKDQIRIFVLIYFDDILIYSEDEKEHPKHVKIVLDILRKNNLFVNPAKCSFHVKTIDFLGYIVTAGEGIKMNPDKIKAITEWKEPKNLKQVQSFLGFANFYRRFILNYSKIIRPLTKLLSKNEKFNWTPECTSTFNLLKEKFTSSPILRFFDFSKPCILETDASDFALGAILSQEHEGFYHPVAFHSRQFSGHEINYDVHDKELLAIVDSFKKFRHYLIAVPEETIVYTDHNNLTKFELNQQLNRRQFRWAQFLSEYNFKIIHRPGKMSEKPDALSRKCEYSDIHKNKNFLRLFQRLSDEEGEIITPTPHHTTLGINKVLATPSNQPIYQTSTTSLDFTSEFLQKIKNSSSTLPSELEKRNDYIYRDGTYLVNNKIYLPPGNLRQEIFEVRHNRPTAGHYGLLKTLQLVSRNYYWIGMKKDIANFISGCYTCKRNKSTKHKKFGLLQPLPIPTQRWQALSMDFITDLPVSQGFDSLFVVKDRLTKQAHFIPCKKTITAEQTAHLLIKEVVRLHGLPENIVSDRGPQFKANFFREFFKILGVSTNLSTSFHPETDGSTEVLNQTIEQYIRIFGDAHQTDWVTHLPLAEFTYNNTINSTTNLTPFYANLGYHPLMDFHDIPSKTPASLNQINLLKEILKQLQINLSKSQQQYSIQANKHRQPIPSTIKVGSKVFLNRKNISPKFGIKKFSQKYFGPFKIIQQINPVAFKLELPPTLKIHPVFHVSLLEPAPDAAYPDQNAEAQPILVEEQVEYEVDQILDARGKGKHKKYLVHWTNTDESENSWEPAVNLTNCKELLKQFHQSRNI